MSAQVLGTRAPRDTLLHVDGVHVSYGAITALRGVGLTVGKGEIVALIGANGAGKTSTLRAISGMLKPQQGRISLEGRSLVGLKAHEIVPLGMAHAPEGRGIFLNLTVEENLDLGAYLRTDKDGIAKDREEGFTLFPILRERRAQRAGTLSGGEQQMLAIGRALMTNPRLLVLDEATEGLAPLIRAEIWRALAALKAEGLSMVVIDKNLGPLMGLADRHFVLEKGRVVWSGDSAALRREPRVVHEYLGV